MLTSKKKKSKKNASAITAVPDQEKCADDSVKKIDSTVNQSLVTAVSNQEIGTDDSIEKIDSSVDQSLITTVPDQEKGADDSVKKFDSTVDQSLVTTLSDQGRDTDDSIEKIDSIVDQSLVTTVSNDEYLKQGARPKVRGSLLTNKKKKSKKNAAAHITETIISASQECNAGKGTVVMECVGGAALLISGDAKVFGQSQEQIVCIEDKDKDKLCPVEVSDVHAVSTVQQGIDEKKAVIGDVNKILLGNNDLRLQDYDHVTSKGSVSKLCTSGHVLDMTGENRSEFLETCEGENAAIGAVISRDSDLIDDSILQKKQKNKSQLTKSQRQRANRKARKVREQAESVDVCTEPNSVEYCELETKKEEDTNLLSCFNYRIGPALTCNLMSLRYVLSKYPVTTDSMCKTRFSHLLYYLRLTYNLFMPAKVNGISVLVVTEAAEKALKDFFSEKQDYDFFLSMVKLCILTNFLMIIRPHSKFVGMTALFKHYYKIFTMDLDAFLVDIIQEFYCISSENISLDKLRSHVLKVFEKYESEFSMKGYTTKEYPLDFLEKVLGICLPIYNVQCSSVSEVHAVIYSASVVCVVTHIGHIVQQSNRIFAYHSSLIRKNTKSGFVFDFVKQCYSFRNTSCHLYDSKTADAGLDFFKMASKIVNQFQMFMQHNSADFFLI